MRQQQHHMNEGQHHIDIVAIAREHRPEGKALALQVQRACLIRQPQQKAEQRRDSSLPAKLLTSGATMIEGTAWVRRMIGL